MASISFRNVTKRFGDTVALDDVSFDIDDNEFFCFFGPPLSGKSTILRLILGLDRPDSGDVIIDGKAATQVGPAERNIAMVFQNLALFPHMTARDNVAFPLVERGVARDRIAARVAEVADKLHMTHILHKHPAQLSGGERQRVAIARALVRDPVAYLMDDPISALDARLREETRIELKRIQQDVGHTLVYVTHDQEEAMSVADRMAILRDGRVQQIDTPITIYDRPANAYVASILGAPAINLMAVAAGQGLSDNGAVTLPAAGMDGVARIGLRPEDTQLVPWQDGQPGDASTVVGVETLGGSTIVTVDPPKGDTPLRLLLRGQPDVTIGAKTGIAYSPDALMRFDAQDQRLETKQ